MKPYLCTLVALGLLMGITGHAMAQPSYRFSTLDVPGSSSSLPTVATGINDSGHIVGNDNITQGFLLVNGTYTTFGVPGAGSSVSAHNSCNEFWACSANHWRIF
jgi:hypothetical protein